MVELESSRSPGKHKAGEPLPSVCIFVSNPPQVLLKVKVCPLFHVSFKKKGLGGAQEDTNPCLNGTSALWESLCAESQGLGTS